MADDYLSLIGAVPDKQQELKAIADALRRRRSFGELATLTGDKVLQPFGASLTGQADDYAKQIQTTRLKQIDDAQTKKYQDDQIRHMDAVLKETMRNNNLDYSLGMAQLKSNEDIKMMLKGSGTNEKAIAKMVAMMDKDSLPGILEAAGAANKILAGYKGKEIPGFGRFKGMLPNATLSSEGQLVRSTLSGVANQILKMRSGAAVTDPEMRRFLEETARGSVDEAVFRKRWPQLMRTLEAAQNNIHAFAPDKATVAEYYDRRGSKPFKAYDPFTEDEPQDTLPDPSTMDPDERRIMEIEIEIARMRQNGAK